MEKPPEGFESTMALGKKTPDPAGLMVRKKKKKKKKKVF
jgi:hypothetical protein